MSSLFGSLLGVANQNQQGEMQGQQLLRQYMEQQDADKLAQRKQSFAEMLQAAQAGNYQSEMQDRLWKQQHPTIDPNAPEVLARKQSMETQKIKDENQFGYHAPVMPFEPTGITDPNNPTGSPQLGRFDKRTGATTPTGYGKPVAQKASDVATFSSSSLEGAQRAHQNLTQFGSTLQANGPIGNFMVGHNPLDHTLQQANQAADSWVAFATPIQYRGRTTKVESDLVRKGQVPVMGDNAATINQKKLAREDVIRKAQAMGGQVSTQTPTVGASPQQLWDAAVQLHGQEKVEQEYGPRPSQ